MSDFQTAVKVVLANEGGWVNDSADPGGATNYGISLRWLRTVQPGADEQTIRHLTVEQAAGLYRRYWWEANGYGLIVDQRCATKIFDTAVNVGATEAHRLVQKALCDCGVDVEVDGIFGPQTLEAVNAVDSLRFLGKLVSEQADFYTRLALSKPELGKFLPNWLHRASWPLGHDQAA